MSTNSEQNVSILNESTGNDTIFTYISNSVVESGSDQYGSTSDENRKNSIVKYMLILLEDRYL